MSSHSVRDERRTYMMLKPFGVRGLVLSTLGVLWVLIGVSGLTVGLSPLSVLTIDYMLDELFFLNTVTVSAAWIATGIMGIITSRWPPYQDSWGFFFLAPMPMFWALLHLVGAIFHGPILGVLVTVVYAVMCVLLWGISKLEDPSMTPPNSIIPTMPDTRLLNRDAAGDLR